MPKQTKKELSPLPTDERELIQFEKLSEGIYAINYKTKPTYMKYSKEQVMKALDASNNSTLRIMSNYFLQCKW
jgi:endo-alpha-1,4-polygalactosaminidase (GH114 family)